MKKRAIGLMSLLLLLGFGATTRAQSGGENVWRLTTQGRKLSSQEAENLEEKLKGNPNDLSMRTILLAYYEGKHESQVSEAKQRHVLWIIENHPESEIAGSPECLVLEPVNQVYFDEAKKRWLKQVDLHKNNPDVLGNAASFFLLSDRELAEALLKQAETLDPKTSAWPERLGDLYSSELEDTFGKVRSKLAAQSLQKYERALSLAEYDFEKADLLGSVAKAAFDAGNLIRAKAYASHLLKKYGRDKDFPSYDDAVFEGNQILGRVALRNGNITRAKVHLLDSVRISGSPTLSTFGPDMTLAKELLERAQKTAVIEFLHLCAKFWKDEGGLLKDWEADIRKGRMPDFQK
jgi:tetratricopeptide (TPR) repeat protein